MANNNASILSTPITSRKRPRTEITTTPVSTARLRMPDPPKRQTVASRISARLPVQPETAEPIEHVLKAHGRECIVSVPNEKNFIDSLVGKSGIYMISGDDYSKSPDVLMKIGKAKDLNHRLRQYFFCYPGGFFIYGIILTQTTFPAQEKFTSRHKTEQSIHAYLRYLNLNILQKHGRSGEWFLIQSEDVSKIFLVALSVASEMGLAEAPYCYAFFPPIFVKEYKSREVEKQMYRPVMSEADAQKLESTLVDERYRPKKQEPILKGAQQTARGLAPPKLPSSKKLDFVDIG